LREIGFHRLARQWALRLRILAVMASRASRALLLANLIEQGVDHPRSLTLDAPDLNGGCSFPW